MGFSVGETTLNSEDYNRNLPRVIALLCSILLGVQFDFAGCIFLDLGGGVCSWYILSGLFLGIIRLEIVWTFCPFKRVHFLCGDRHPV